MLSERAHWLLLRKCSREIFLLIADKEASPMSYAMHHLHDVWGDEHPPDLLEEMYKAALLRESHAPMRAVWVALRKYVSHMGGHYRIGEDNMARLARIARKLTEEGKS